MAKTIQKKKIFFNKFNWKRMKVIIIIWVPRHSDMSVWNLRRFDSTFNPISKSSNFCVYSRYIWSCTTNAIRNNSNLIVVENSIIINWEHKGTTLKTMKYWRSFQQVSSNWQLTLSPWQESVNDNYFKNCIQNLFQVLTLATKNLRNKICEYYLSTYYLIYYPFLNPAHITASSNCFVEISLLMAT